MSDGGRPFIDPGPAAAEAAYLEYVKAFVDAAAAEGEVDERARSALVSRADARVATLRSAAVPAPLVASTRRTHPTAWVAPGAPTAPPHPRGVVVPDKERTPRPAPRPNPIPGDRRAPSHRIPQRQPVEPLSAPARRMWKRWTTVIAGDLAVHGLAYLGVLLLFAGIFGLVVFAFGDVAPAWRPVAETATPLGLFGSAWFLRRRGAPFVGDALLILAGAVVPIVFVASLSDGSGLPPDLEGRSLVVALTSGCLFIAGVYAWGTGRRPNSLVRFLFAPMAWLSVAMAALATRDPIPTGKDIATPHALQMAIVAISIVATAALCRRWPQLRLAREVETSAAVAFPVIYTLELLAAWVEGWPAGPLATVGFAGVLLVEALGHRLDVRVAGVAQAVLLAAAIAPFVPTFGTAETAAFGVASALVLTEWIGWRRPSLIACAVSLVAAGTALVFTITDPWSALVAGTAVWAWVVVRRARPPRWLAGDHETAWTAAAALAPLLPATSVPRLTDIDVSMLVLAIAAAAIAVASRLFARRDDALWRWWPRTALVAVGIGTGGAAPTGVTGILVTSSIVVAGGLAIAPGPFAEAFWSTAGATVWAAILVADFAGLAVATTALAFAVVAVSLIGASNNGRAGVHLGLLGHLLAFGTLVVIPLREWSSVSVEVMFAAGWLLTLVRQELGRCALLDAITSSAGREGPGLDAFFRRLPAVMVVVSVPLVTVSALDAGDVHGSWWGPVLALAGAVPCAVSRVITPRRPTARTLAIGGLWTTVGAIAELEGGSGRVAIALSAAIIAGFVVPAAIRPPVVLWWTWSLFAIWTVTMSVFLGLDAEQRFAVLLSWGAVVLIGTLFVDDRRAGRRTTGELVRNRAFVPPLTISCAAIAIALSAAFGHGRLVYGSWSLVAAAVALVTAFELRAGIVTVITYALGGVGLAALAPFDAIDLPWTIVGFAGVLVLWRGALKRMAHEPSPIGRWDTAPAIVAYASLSIALGLTSDAGYVPATFLGSAVVVGLVALVERDARWVIAGDALALVGAAALGDGWLAIALAVTSVAATAVAVRSNGPARASLQVAGVSAACASWIALLAWFGASLRDATVWSAVVGGAIALVVAAGLRWLRLPVEWARIWLVPVVLGIGYGMSVAATTASIALRDDALVASAAALTLAAVATALSATPLSASVPWIRILTVPLMAGAAASFAVGWEVTEEQAAWWSMATGFGCTLVALAAIAMRPRSPWLPSWLAAGAVAAAAAIVVSATGSLEPYVPMTALLTAAVETAALGTVMRRTEVLALSPPLACAGWLVFAYDAFAGEPMWFGIPIGIGLLVDTGLIRWRHRADGEPIATPPLIAMDDVGMVFVLGTPLIEAVAVTSVDALIGMVAGVAITTWGVMTKVRRRVIGGAVSVVLAALILIVAPLVPLLPETTGPALWATIAAAGLLIIIAAASLEQGRARLHHGVEHLESIMRGWE